MITTTAPVAAREAKPRRRTATLLWAPQILLATMFVLGAALPKLIGDHSAVQEFGPNVWMTLVLCAVFVLIAYGRRQQIKGLAAAIRR